MSTDNDTVKSGGIGLTGLFFITLFVLKVLDKIEMSWFLVITSFIWFPILMILAVIAIVFVIGLIYTMIDDPNFKIRNKKK